MQDIKERMQKSIENLNMNFAKIRTGRAHTSLLDSIIVSYYGTDTPLKQVANIVAEDARTLMLTVFDKTMVQAVEKAILNSDLGLNPATSGSAIRIPLPPLTEETRKNYIKHAKAEAEHARIAIRNIRRDALELLKKQVKTKEISEDDEKRSAEQVQKTTDQFIKDVDSLLSAKEKDLIVV